MRGSKVPAWVVLAAVLPLSGYGARSGSTRPPEGEVAAELASVDLDEVAGPFGLVQGEAYTLALFFAERHTTGSSFRVETTIAEFAVCPE